MTPDTGTGGIHRSDTRARGDMASDNGLRGGTVPRVIPHPVSTRGAIRLVLRIAVAGPIAVARRRVAVKGAIAIVSGVANIAVTRVANQSGPAPPSQTSLSLSRTCD